MGPSPFTRPREGTPPWTRAGQLKVEKRRGCLAGKAAQGYGAGGDAMREEGLIGAGIGQIAGIVVFRKMTEENVLQPRMEETADG